MCGFYIYSWVCYIGYIVVYALPSLAINNLRKKKLVACSRYTVKPVLSDHSKIDNTKVFLLWIIYVISVLFCYAVMHVCLLVPCGHLLGKG